MNSSQGGGGNPGSSMPGWHQWDNQGHEPGTAAQTGATGQGGWNNPASGVGKDLGGGMGGTGISDGGGAAGGPGHLQDDGSNPGSTTPSLMQPGTQPGALLQQAGHGNNGSGGGKASGGGGSGGGGSGSGGSGGGGGVGSNGGGGQGAHGGQY